MPEQAMKAYAGLEVYLHSFLTLALTEVSSHLHADRSRLPTEWRAGWAPQAAWAI
jgi:hypothetical protein